MMMMYGSYIFIDICQIALIMIRQHTCITGWQAPDYIPVLSLATAVVQCASVCHYVHLVSNYKGIFKIIWIGWTL